MVKITYSQLENYVKKLLKNKGHLEIRGKKDRIIVENNGEKVTVKYMGISKEIPLGENAFNQVMEFLDKAAHRPFVIYLRDTIIL